MIDYRDMALKALVPGCQYASQNSEIFWDEEENNGVVCPSQEQIQTKIAELAAAEPMRLLRIERDLKLQESDWRTNNDYPYDDADAWAIYRTALRNLPAEITAGNVAAPVIQDGAFVFDDWPQVPNA